MLIEGFKYWLEGVFMVRYYVSLSVCLFLSLYFFFCKSFTFTLSCSLSFSHSFWISLTLFVSHWHSLCLTASVCFPLLLSLSSSVCNLQGLYLPLANFLIKTCTKEASQRLTSTEWEKPINLITFLYLSLSLPFSLTFSTFL